MLDSLTTTINLTSSAVATAVGAPTEAMPHASYGRKTSSNGRSLHGVDTPQSGREHSIIA